MDIDITLLRALEREKEISFDILVDALEQALLTAYHKTPGAETQRAGPGRPQDRAGHGARRRGRRGGRGRCGSTTTRPRASAGSPPPRPSR